MNSTQAFSKETENLLHFPPALEFCYSSQAEERTRAPLYKEGKGATLIPFISTHANLHAQGLTAQSETSRV